MINIYPPKNDIHSDIMRLWKTNINIKHVKLKSVPHIHIHENIARHP